MRIKIAKILRGTILALSLLFLSDMTVNAQCPMCKMGAESNLKNGGTAGRGLNAGILLLFSTPYLLVGGIAYVWYRNRKSKEDVEIEEQLSLVEH
jgi:hypothetical protein